MRFFKPNQQHNHNQHKKLMFTPIHHHPRYSQIKQVLKKIQITQLNTNQITEVLSLFNAITNDRLSERHGLMEAIFSRFKEIINTNNYQYKTIMLKQDLSNYIQSYDQLKKHYYTGIPQIFSHIASFILSFDNQNNSRQIQNIPLCLSKQTQPIILNKKQIMYLMSLMAFNLVPKQNHSNYSYIYSKFNKSKNFSAIFNNQPYKTSTIIEYFKQFLFKNQSYDKKLQANQVFTIKREVINQKLDFILNQNSSKLMIPFQLMENNDSIQNYTGQIKIDFANKYIGGGALTRGCVQEEIMYANHPQLYVSAILCESIKDNQSILYSGFNKYFKNIGYGYGTKYGGKQEPNNYEDTDYIVAIDAIDFKSGQNSQYQVQNINRQILKAYAGFKNSYEIQTIVTGNWGCGAFKGDVRLKFLIQWIAASLAGKKMKYCPYGKKHIINQIFPHVKSLTMQTVKQMHFMLLRAVSYAINFRDTVFSALDFVIQNKVQHQKKQWYRLQKINQSEKREQIQLRQELDQYNNNFYDQKQQPMGQPMQIQQNEEVQVQSQKINQQQYIEQNDSNNSHKTEQLQPHSGLSETSNKTEELEIPLAETNSLTMPIKARKRSFSQQGDQNSCHEFVLRKKIKNNCQFQAQQQIQWKDEDKEKYLEKDCIGEQNLLSIQQMSPQAQYQQYIRQCKKKNQLLTLQRNKLTQQKSHLDNNHQDFK